ncbi:Dps family protein [Algoriphagus namhaensis]
MTTLEKNKATLSNHLNLDNEKMGDITHDMNNLLSDYHIFYQNLRGFHWNIKGNDFFTLHEQFEELYTVVYQNIDELAERIVTIGFKPMHSFSDYLKNSILNEVTDVEDAEECVKHVVDGLGSLVQSHRKIAIAAGDAGDIATEDMLTAFVAELEKRMWMFTKYLR